MSNTSVRARTGLPTRDLARTGVEWSYWAAPTPPELACLYCRAPEAFRCALTILGPDLAGTVRQRVGLAGGPIHEMALCAACWTGLQADLERRREHVAYYPGVG